VKRKVKANGDLGRFLISIFAIFPSKWANHQSQPKNEAGLDVGKN